MSFVTAADFKPYIKDETLDRVIQNDNAVLTEVVLATTEEVISYLSGTYDTDTIFAQTGAARNKFIMQKMIDMSLYHLYSRLRPHAIPDIRKDRYDEAIEWLKGVAKGMYNASLPRKVDVDGDTITNLKYGGHDKQEMTW